MSEQSNCAPAKTFELGDLELQCERVLPQARLVYQTYGTLAPDKSNCILYPTSYGAQHVDIDWLIGPEGILDPSRYFIVIPNMFTNGLSTSPSNCVSALEEARWPAITHVDNVRVQRRLLREELGIERLALIYGWSMGAQQAFHWGALYPGEVERILALCGSARTSPHNLVFLEGVKAALSGDSSYRDGWFEGDATRGKRAMGRVYAGWALSQAFYRRELWRQFGAISLEDFLVRFWEANFLRRNANDLLAQLEVWARSDISLNDRFKGDLAGALGAITARTIVMPGSSDLYFTAEDSRIECEQMPNAEYRPIVSDFGHRAGNPTHFEPDRVFIRDAVSELLS